jgi:oligosaccharide repeat unit polymerase
MTNLSQAAAGSSVSAGLPKTIPRKSIWIALSCCAGAVLAVSTAIAGASSATSLLLLAAVPASGLMVYGLREANRFASQLDIFSPLVAFPVLYVSWFAVGSIDMIDVPATVTFGLFEPIPGYVLGYAALGLIAYLVGAGLWRVKPGGNEIENQGEHKHEHKEDRIPEFAWREDRFAAVSVGLGFLMFASYAYLIASMGAIPALSADAGEIRLRILQSGPAEAVLFTCAWTLIPMLMMYVWRGRPRRRIKFLCYAGVAVSSVLLLSLGGRSYLFVPLLTTLVARHYGKRRYAIKKLALVCVILFCGVSLFGYVRDTALSRADFGDDQVGIPGTVVPFVYSYLYVRYSVATLRDVIAIVPSKVSYQYGALSFGPLATVLPGNHEQSDMFFKNALGNDFIGAGQPATLLGPLYADAGVPGIVAGLFLAGMFIARTYGWMLAEPTVIRVLLYTWLMQTLLFSLFANLFPYITTIWIPLFWMALHGFLRKPATESDGSLSPAFGQGALHE